MKAKSPSCQISPDLQDLEGHFNELRHFPICFQAEEKKEWQSIYQTVDRSIPTEVAAEISFLVNRESRLPFRLAVGCGAHNI